MYFFKDDTFLQDMCLGISNITLHAFCCSKAALWYFVICRKRTSMHHILHNDLHFLPRACRANPAGTVILLVFWCTNLHFFTNFTFRALLKHNYCNILMFWVRNWSEIVGFNQHTRVFLRRWQVFAKYVSGNPKYQVSRVLLSRIRTFIFCNLLKTLLNTSYSP